MKTVFDNSNVAHVWASQIQNEGRNAGSTFFFRDGAIYSYGYHFMIAKHFTNDNGTVVLFTNRSYSNSTTKQINYTRHAVNGAKLIFCWNPNGTAHAENFNNWCAKMESHAAKLLTARKPELYLNNIAAEYAQCKIYAEYFGLEIPADIQLLSELENKSQYAEIQEKRNIAAIDVEKKKAAILKKSHGKQLKEWRAFKTQRVYLNDGLDYLRFNSDTNRIETSQGVQIPASKALDFYTYILDTLTKGGCTECNKMLLDYQVREINANYIRVGCHKISIPEVKKAVKQMTTA